MPSVKSKPRCVPGKMASPLLEAILEHEMMKIIPRTNGVIIEIGKKYIEIINADDDLVISPVFHDAELILTSRTVQKDLGRFKSIGIRIASRTEDN